MFSALGARTTCLEKIRHPLFEAHIMKCLRTTPERTTQAQKIRLAEQLIHSSQPSAVAVSDDCRRDSRRRCGCFDLGLTDQRIDRDSVRD